jgi:hypothetical protein
MTGTLPPGQRLHGLCIRLKCAGCDLRQCSIQRLDDTTMFDPVLSVALTATALWCERRCHSAHPSAARMCAIACWWLQQEQSQTGHTNTATRRLNMQPQHMKSKMGSQILCCRIIARESVLKLDVMWVCVLKLCKVPEPLASRESCHRLPRVEYPAQARPLFQCGCSQEEQPFPRGTQASMPTRL